MKITRVVIVGGGSSGWMTAAALSKVLPKVKISLVESKNIKTIGVGESTLGFINNYLNFLGLEDEDWMAECDATYKNSIRFTDFREKGTVFEYPFGPFFTEGTMQGLNDWHLLRSLFPDQIPPESFSRFYNANTYLADFNRQTRNLDGKLRGFNFKTDTAYHMDAEKFGIYLKNKIAIPNGVQHLEGTVVSWSLKDDGSIQSITTDNDLTLEADLFIDCTGFKSLLLEQIQKSSFIPFKDVLLNDRAMAARIPYVDREKEMENVTNCTAIENGWVWNIPLWNRIGTGYVYSSSFVDDQKAEEEFRRHLARDPKFTKRAEEAEVFKINIRHGKREKAWKNNVVGIGLSYGFVEPLESTGLMTTHQNILRLIEVLLKRDCHVNGFDKDMYNYCSDLEIERFKEFIALHYAFSTREDTDYWKYATGSIQYRPLSSDLFQRRTHLWEATINTYLDSSNVSTDSNGIAYIAAGMGYMAASKNRHNNYQKNQDNIMFVATQIKKKWEEYNAEMITTVLSLPTHFQFLKENIYMNRDEK